MADEIIGRISVGDGATFTPAVSSAGELSWTNNKNLPNPEPVDIAQAVVDADALDSRYLQLSGGTMTGDIVRTPGSLAVASADDGYIQLYGGIGYDHGAWLNLTGKDHKNTGRWSLQANDGTNRFALTGNANGTLTWGENTVPTKNVNIQVGKTAFTSVPAGDSVAIPITFSAAFSSTPVVLATVQTNYKNFTASVGSVTTSGASISLNNASGTDRSVVVGWMAISI